MDVTFATRTHQSWTILSVSGELDLFSSPQLKRALDEIIDEASHVLLDLSGVPFMDSSSLGVIVGDLKRARERGGELAIMGLQASPAKVVALTGLDSVFRIVDDPSQLSA